MRPDNIDAAELVRLRRYGCTRVQLGVQHTDDAVLKKINRGCTTQQVREVVVACTFQLLLQHSSFIVRWHARQATGVARAFLVVVCEACVHVVGVCSGAQCVAIAQGFVL